MRTRPLIAGLLIGIAAIVVAALVFTNRLPIAAPPPAPQPSTATTPPVPTYAFAVLSNVPYGDQQLSDFSEYIEAINDDPDIRLAAHIGNIKSDGAKCALSDYEAVRRDFDKFEDALLYVPGEYDWTTCHQPSSGSYDPLDRLGQLREVFFPVPERSLGQNRVDVASYATNGFPENRRYTTESIIFATMHLVGNDNGATPWAGRAEATNRQRAEIDARTASAVQVVKDTFAAAAERKGSTVVLLTQGDMFKAASGSVAESDSQGYGPVVRTIAQLSAQFAGEVYLINGATATMKVDRPLSTRSPWLKRYGVDRPLTNFTQIATGGLSGTTSYLKVETDPTDRRYLVWTEVPFES